MREVTLGELGEMFIRRWKWIVAVTLLVAGIGMVLNLKVPTLYESVAVISFHTGSPQYPSQPREAPSELQSPEVARQVISVLDAEGLKISLEPAALLNLVQIIPVPSSSNWTIIAQSDSAEKAVRIANAWADVAVENLNSSFLVSPETVDLALKNLENASGALQEFVQAKKLAGYDLYAVAQVDPLFAPTRTLTQTIPAASNPPGRSDLPVLTPADQSQLATLLQGQELASAVYSELLVEAEKKQLMVQAGGGPARVTGRASGSLRPVVTRSVENVVIAGLVGLMLGMFGVVFFELAKR